MRSYLIDFNDVSGVEVGPPRQLDRDDWHAAMGGYSNGRNHRHLAAYNPDDLIQNRKKDDDLIDFVLSQPPYDVLFADTMTKLRDAESAVDGVLDLVARRLAEDQAKLDGLISRAARLPDGAKVARDKDDAIRTLDGKIVAPDQTAQIELNGNEPTFEEIQAQRQKVEADLAIQSRAHADQNRLGEIREELADKPPSDRLKELGEEAETIKERNGALVSQFNNDNVSTDQHMTVLASTATLPDLSN